MAELFASGRVIDCILGLMLLEVLTMAWWRRRTGGGLNMAELLATIGAGAALLLAWKSSLVGPAWPAAAFWLLVALAAHVADLMLRSARRRTISALR